MKPLFLFDFPFRRVVFWSLYAFGRMIFLLTSYSFLLYVQEEEEEEQLQQGNQIGNVGNVSGLVFS